MSGTEPRSRGGGGLKLALLALIAVGLAAVLYVMGAAVTKPGQGEGLERYAKGSLGNLTVLEDPRRAPPDRLSDGRGQAVRIADLPGEIRVVNLWATWCAPCIAEMPTLARLQAAYPERVHVAAISLDRPLDAEKARLFIAQHAPLAFYHAELSLAGAVNAPGLPMTLIYDAEGVELARVPAAAEWDSAEARRLIDALLAR